MYLAALSERIGDPGVMALIGLFVGLLFGGFAQRSQFCLRASTVEFWRGTLGPRTAIWLIVFGVALFGVQLLFAYGQLETESVRQISSAGTMSGAIIGGAMFGAGMILARGCASRLLVLSATGNLRSFVTGLILTVAAQASLRGALSPARTQLSSLWIIDPETRNLMEVLPAYSGIFIGLAILAVAAYAAKRYKLSSWAIFGGVGVGVAVVLGWWLTAILASNSFEVVPVQSVSFTGPSADTLMTLINEPHITFTFGLGLVPGVFLGSFLASIIAGDFHIETFSENAPLPRYIIGAILMGFGSMLAGGCAVGAGVTGGAVLALTAWVALLFMWLVAGATDYFVDRPKAQT
ncbi:MAG: YeeE/YedE family protein [Rhizobiaceae bacterium]